MTTTVLNLDSVLTLTDAQFLAICQANPDLKLEQTATGALVIVAPTGGDTGAYNAELNADVVIWNRRTQLGVVFDSSTCFKLPNQAKRSPDIAWITKERWLALSPEQRQTFPPIAPDFVLELVSPSDSLSDVQAKMREYLDNGVRLGWLLDPARNQVEIYRPDRPVAVLQTPVVLSGEDVLPNFELSIAFTEP